MVHRSHSSPYGHYALMVIALVAGLGCQKEAEIHQYDHEAVTALAKLGATYELDRNGRVVEIKLDNTSVDDAALHVLTDLTELKTLSLYGTAVTDNCLPHLENLGRLESLGLGNTQITDKGLVRVARIPNLKWLWIGESKKTTKRGIAALRKSRPQLTIYE